MLFWRTSLKTQERGSHKRENISIEKILNIVDEKLKGVTINYV